MRGRTCILVTHAVGLVLPGVSYAVVLDAGNVVAAGKPDELRTQGHFQEDELEDDAKEMHTHAIQQDGKVVHPDVEDGTLMVETIEGDNVDREETKKQQDRNTPLLKDTSMKAEKQEQGSVEFRIYGLYFKSMGAWWYWALIILFFVGSQALQIETNAWIRDWANANERVRASLVTRSMSILGVSAGSEAVQAHADAVYYLSIYIALNLAFGLAIAIRVFWLFQGSLRASRSLYKRLLLKVLAAKMRYVAVRS